MNTPATLFSNRVVKSIVRLPRRTYSSLHRRYKRTKIKLSWKRLRKLPYKILVRSYWMRLGELSHYTPRPIRLEKFPSFFVPREKLPSMVIVTPSYQQKDFLVLTMQSILEQNYPRLSYIVNDGGSKDGTREILEQFSHRLHCWSSAKDNGQADAVQRGFTQARGDLMAWVNSDDLLLPGALQFIGSYFALHPEVDVIYGHRILINETGEEIGRWILPPHHDESLRYVDYVPQETLFWRRSIYEKAGGVDPGFHFALDWDLLLRFRSVRARIVRVPYFLGCFRIHPQQKTSSVINTRGMAEMNQLRLREHGRELSNDEIDHYSHRLQLRAALTARLLSLGIRR